ncbi:T9SS type A sorting domain-containing protein [Algibacter miyuki]|uniref:T9SS type A sorting domain-containing protein n=1 Tax=Algibacter miyuki TaxID=1306933 RepID=A0ABV5H2G1_9FLAO|nr:T9SS type A sorting domain-containing protein [Algibacter miyuki]MDN3664133.1 T9SS type A sorting domain-containing protein [Algibacter miyuki]
MPLNLGLLVWLVSSQLATAQLSVRNNAAIFIKDEIVFVEDDINLEETASTIYLRDEAQIIQGTGTTGNSGEGELSVYQDGNVDAYEYNFWCSPTGNHDDTLVNNPFGVTLLNDINTVINSTPADVTPQPNRNGSATDLKIDPYWIWKYIGETDYTGWVHVGNATTIEPGQGFTMKGTQGSGSNQNYDFRGKPNNGHIEVSVTNGAYSLVGNPYPSAMDAHAYIWDTNNKTSITGTLYYWEQNPNVNSHNLNAYDGGYTTYLITEDGTTETITSATFTTFNNDGSENGSTGTTAKLIKPGRHIPIGQGFMVQGASGIPSNSTVNAENSHRIYEKENMTTSVFFKSANSKNTEPVVNSIFTTVNSEYKRFRLNVDFNNTYTRQLVETFNNNATEGFDRGLESRLHERDILSADAYFPIGDLSYLAEALVYDEDLKIPLTIEVNNDMPVRIRIADVQNFDTDLPIFIHDKTTNLYVNLKSQSFNVNLDAGKYTDRFEVTFKAATLSTELLDVNTINAFQNNKTSTLTLTNPSLLNIKSILVYDVTGKQVLTDKPSSTKLSHSISTKQLSTGVYILNAVLDNNIVFNKKIMITE